MTQGIDVSDLFDGFHRLAACLWQEFGRAAAAAPDEQGISFDDLVDQLEIDVFLPACARRAREELGLQLDADDIGAHIILVDASGTAVPGGAGRYHSHAFHPPGPEGDVPPHVLAANLLPRPRSDVTLLLVAEPPERRADRPRARGLPLH
jgi:hypothetical protein